MKPKSNPIEKDFDKNLKTFEQQPKINQELQLLKDLDEKTTGKENAPIQKLIQDKSKIMIHSQSDLLP